jgi:signal transduction histidine kinase/CheY-like chemotaxis protein/HPt (histidine-containing phosphotransfer) domain-containing protein
VDEELGRGGMGIVYKAFDTAYGRDVAVKVLPDQIAEDELLYRFRREGSEMAGMSHPNVIHCYEFGTHENNDFIVMEYVEGGNLRQYVKNCQSLADIVSAYCAICEGLDHIHGHGIVHRDLKPGNILFTSSGMPKIADFGISRRLDSDTQLTQVGTIMGTSSFVAPEMIVDSSGVTPSADLYALGVCLFESLTGELPIKGDTEYAVLNAHLNTKPAAPSELRPEIPQALDAITLQLLAKAPQDRPASARETASLLRDCLAQALPIKSTVADEPLDEHAEVTASGKELEGLITIDPEGRIESCNVDAAILLGRASGELFGQPIDRFIPKLRTLTQKNSNLNSQTFNMEGRKRVESPIPLEVTLTATQSARGQQLSASLRMGEPDVETVASNMVKEGRFDYLTRMTHEVWTPMNGILGMTRLTLNTDLDPQQRRYLKAVESSAERLDEVLQTAFDFSRLGDGSLQLEPVPINVRLFLESVLRPYIFEAAAKNLEFQVQVAPLVPDIIVADPTRLKQILRHLLQNSLKFTETGEIGVTLARESGDDNVVQLKFSVSDTGRGILPGQEKSIFRPFFQEDSSISRQTGGVGLGLAIVQGLVNKMDGRTWVESQRGRGSVFHVVADFGIAEAAGETSFRTRLGGLKALMVDPAKQYGAVAKMMKKWGLDVLLAESPKQAGEYIESARADDRPFDLVMAEVHGPHFDAYSFVKSYKLSREAFLLFTDEIRHGDTQQCRSLGVDALLGRPINSAELWDAVLKVFKNGPRSQNAAFGSLRILLAEDNPINQMVATALLASHGHEVEKAENGLEVLQKLETGEFDLILMDLQMPQMDGITTTKRIRENEQISGKRIPIVALTAHMKGDSLDECMAAGMEAYLNKPIDEDRLLEVIAQVVDDNNGDAKASPETPAESEEPMRDTETTNYNVVDEKALLARIGNNSQNLCALLDIFLNLYSEQLAQIRSAIDEADAEKLFGSAHKFKGSVANFGADAAMEAAVALEELGRSGSTMGAEAEYTALVKETEILVVSLRSIRARHTSKR